MKGRLCKLLNLHQPPKQRSSLEQSYNSATIIFKNALYMLKFGSLVFFLSQTFDWNLTEKVWSTYFLSYSGTEHISIFTNLNYIIFKFWSPMYESLWNRRKLSLVMIQFNFIRLCAINYQNFSFLRNFAAATKCSVACWLRLCSRNLS